jgi:hypothetical protein
VSSLPNHREAITQDGSLASVTFRRWLEGLSNSASATESDIAAIASALGSPDGDVATIPPQDSSVSFVINGGGSVEVGGTLEGGVFNVTLDGDETNPGPTRTYGTDSNGNKGWHHLISPAYVVVNTKADLPDAVAGVVTLEDDACYLLTDIIDMAGDRIVCGTNNSLIGASANTCGLLFSGGGSSTWITSASSLSFRYIQLTANTGTLFSLDSDVTHVLLWEGCRILDTPTIGTVKDYQNVVWKDQIISNSANLTLDGTFASFVAETALFDGRAGQTTITVPSTATFLRRFRMLYTAFQVDAGETGINFSTSATIPSEAYILDNVSFAGAGTYLAGITHTSNKALFFNCSGITNSNAVTQYYMTGSATATTIASTGTFVKIAGTTTEVTSVTQKFSNSTSNRAQYTGAFPGSFLVTVFASMTSGNNQNLRMRVAVNGTTMAESTSRFQTSGSGAASNIGTQAMVSLSTNDYVEVFVANDTATTNITVSDLNVTVTRF